MNSRQLLKTSSITILEVLQNADFGEHNKDAELNDLGRIMPKLIKESLKNTQDLNWHAIKELATEISEQLIVILKSRQMGPRATSGFLSWLSDYQNAMVLIAAEEDQKQAVEELAEKEEIESLLQW